MKVYIASHSRELAVDLATILTANGIVVISGWHDKDFLPVTAHTVSERIEIAVEDAKDVSASDALVLIAGPDKYSGGKFVEAGIAIGLGIPVVILGRRENMLLWLPNILAVETPTEIVSALYLAKQAVWNMREDG